MPSFNPAITASILAAIMCAGSTASADPQSPEARYVKPSALNVRGGPGTSNNVLEVLLLGTEVKIYASLGDWSRISPDGQPEKWVYAPMLQRDKPMTRTSTSAPKSGQPEPAAARSKESAKELEKGASPPQERGRAGPNPNDKADSSPNDKKDQPAPRR